MMAAASSTSASSVSASSLSQQPVSQHEAIDLSLIKKEAGSDFNKFNCSDMLANDNRKTFLALLNSSHSQVIPNWIRIYFNELLIQF